MDRSEFDIDAELEKYDYAAAVRDIGFDRTNDGRQHQ